MAQDNPYAAPKSEVGGAEAVDDQRLQRIASGQKFAIYAILLQFLAYGAQAAYGAVGGLVFLAAFVLSVIGIFRLGETVTGSAVLRLFLCVLMIIPLVSLLVLLSLNSRATKQLREGGYRVGLLGASRK